MHQKEKAEELTLGLFCTTQNCQSIVINIALFGLSILKSSCYIRIFRLNTEKLPVLEMWESTMTI